MFHRVNKHGFGVLARNRFDKRIWMVGLVHIDLERFEGH